LHHLLSIFRRHEADAKHLGRFAGITAANQAEDYE
jgi:hypothetical protein